MSMTRKDFEVLADDLKACKPKSKWYDSEHEFNICLAQWRICVSSVAVSCAKINPRFDPLKFKEACGYD